VIHQLIFASPRPGLTEEEFQRYWLDVHAVRYASKIPQIKRYLVDTRIAEPGERGEPLFGGMAEIWLREEEQIASMQTPEFLDGARADEPRWAAFWKTLALDTDACWVDGGPPAPQPAGVKQVTLLKRRPGLDLAGFRRRSREHHARLVLAVPGVRRYLQCHVRDSSYDVGEPRFDSVEQVWFDDLEALRRARGSEAFARAGSELAGFVDPKYVFDLTVREHWIIGPEPRP
jgi:uncharacterized protein (TIGR02118 family)